MCGGDLVERWPQRSLGDKPMIFNVEALEEGLVDRPA
jgi:hypothetical protein